MKYEIGTKFIPRGKDKRICTIVDIHTTTNAKGEIVKQRYVATHEFLGQTITDYDIIDTTIDRGEVLK